jgi:membrane-associated phospholipid phosphatase
MRNPCRSLPFTLALAIAWFSGCSSPRWTNHFADDVWGGAFTEQVQNPSRLVPEAALLATIPVSFYYDDEIFAHYGRGNLDSTTKTSADGLQLFLPSIPVLVGGLKWAGGDSENFEVVAESLGGVVAIQQLMARTIQRERPDQKDDTSFPSGHTSWAFAATTLIVRDVHDPADTSFHAVDALLYLPAAFNAWERVRISHHWASDVTCGALIGVLWTNLVWDAHFKSDDPTRPTVFEGKQKGIAWSPSMDVVDGRPAFGITIGI